MRCCGRAHPVAARPAEPALACVRKPLLSEAYGAAGSSRMQASLRADMAWCRLQLGQTNRALQDARAAALAATRRTRPGRPRRRAQPAGAGVHARRVTPLRTAALHTPARCRPRLACATNPEQQAHRRGVARLALCGHRALMRASGVLSRSPEISTGAAAAAGFEHAQCWDGRCFLVYGENAQNNDGGRTSTS